MEKLRGYIGLLLNWYKTRRFRRLFHLLGKIRKDLKACKMSYTVCLPKHDEYKGRHKLWSNLVEDPWDSV